MLLETQPQIEIKYGNFLQSVEILVPFYDILPSLHRSCLPRRLPASHSDIKISFSPEEGLETRKVARSEDWQGKEISTSQSMTTKGIRTSDPE
jgi:hypothetical protein